MATKAGTITEVVSYEAQKQVDDLVTKLTIAVDLIAKANVNTKGGSVTTNAAEQKEANDAKAESLKITKELTIAEDKLAKQKAIDKEQTRQKNAAIKEEIGLDAKLVGNYQAASNLLKKKIKDYKDATYGVKELTKEMIAERDAIQKLDNEIKTLDKSMGQHQRNVGNYQSAWDGLKSSWVAGVAIMAAVGAALTVVGKFIGSIASATGDLADKWTEMTTAAKFGWESLLTTIATGDFSNLIGNMQKAIEVGKQYAKMLDEVEDRTRTITIAEKDMTLAVDQLRLQLKNVNLSDKERLDLVTKIDNYEKGITVEKKKTAQLALDAEIKKIEGINKVSGAIVIQYLKTQTLNKEQIDKAKEYIELEKKLYVTTLDDRGRATAAIDQNVKKQMATYSKETVNFSGLVKRVGSISDKNMDALIQKYGELSDVTHEYNMSVEKVITKGNTLEAKNNGITGGLKQQQQVISEVKKEWDDYVLSMNNAAKLAANPNLFIGPRNQTFGQVGQGITSETAKPIGMMGQQATSTMTKVDNPTPALTSLDNYSTTDLNMDATAWNSKLQIAAEATSKIDAIVNASYQNRFAAIDAEAAKDQEAKDRELKAAQGNTAKVMEINKRYDNKEAEREKEKKRLQKEQAKYQKTSAIVSAIINTALAVTAQLTLPVVGWVMAALALASGIAEVAVISSQPLPSYAKGRKGGNAELANINELGQEAIITKSGEAYLPQGPLAYLPEGSSVIPHSELVELAGKSSTIFGVPKWESNQSIIMNELRGDIQSLHAGLAMVIKNKPETTWITSGGELHKIVKTGNVYEEWINQNVRL